MLRDHRLALAGSLLVHAVADQERAMQRSAGREPSVATSLLVADLVDATVGILTAPVSATTAGELRGARRRSA